MRIQRRLRQLHRRSRRIEDSGARGDAIQELRPASLMYTHSNTVGDDDGETTRHHRGHEPLLVTERQIETLRKMDALVEHARRRALLPNPVWSSGEGN